jgi:hypothetical protein
MDKSTNSQIDLKEVSPIRMENVAGGYTDAEVRKELILVTDMFKGTISFDIMLGNELYASVPKIVNAVAIYNNL